ncbi:MAG: AMP-binding protein [Porticoccaceae bacterium]
MHSATNNNYDKYPVVWWPTPDAIASTNMARFLTYAGIAETGVEGYNRLLEKSGDKPEWFWQQIVSFFDLRFEQPYTNILDTSEGVPWAKWCVGGTANVVINCLDKYRNTPTWTKPALVWEGEDGRKLEWTYSQLNAEVSRLAEGLRSLGLGVGDVVSLYMPMIPQAAVALLAAAKIGAIIQPLFSGFGADSIVARLSDSGAKAMIIADGTVRRGKTVNMKAVVDEALQSLPNVQSVVVVNNCDVDVNWHNARDNWWSALCAGRDENAATTVVNADDPCMLIHTSGTAGKPKGTLYSHCGFSMKIACDFGLMADYRATDRMMWMSDFGWLVGPVLVTSSLLLGGTIVMAEGAIDYPDAGRFWRLIQDNQVSLLGIAPTIVRSFIHAGGANVESYDLSSIRVSLSTGEPWTMVAWQWMFEKVCKQNAPIVNMSGGTEIGVVLWPIRLFTL